MAKITINQDKCKGCLLCISFCPKGLISVSKKLNKRGVNFAEIYRQSNLKEDGIPRQGGGKNIDECSGCAMCAIICPDCCIEVYK